MAARYDLTPVLDCLGRHHMLPAARALADKSDGKVWNWHRSLYRWQKAGLMRTQAERVASLLGEHPLSLWPDYESCPHCGRAR